MLRTSTFNEKSILHAKPGDACRCRWLASLFVALMCAAIMLICTSDAVARGRSNHSRSSYGRSAAAAAKAQRAKMISGLQKQVANARQILQMAESQSQMTQTELNTATSKLSGIREEIDSTHHDAVAAAKTLRDIEAELILHQPPDSEYAKSQATVDELKNIVHETIHKVLDLPMQPLDPEADPRTADLKQLTSSQLSILQENQSYLDAEKCLKDGAQNVSRIRHKLFQNDSEWVAAHEDLVNANHDTQDGEKERRVAGERRSRKENGTAERKKPGDNSSRDYRTGRIPASAAWGVGSSAEIDVFIRIIDQGGKVASSGRTAARTNRCLTSAWCDAVLADCEPIVRILSDQYPQIRVHYG